MTTERIKEIQLETAYPNSISVQQALFVGIIIFNL
jgi:hypothetical protein